MKAYIISDDDTNRLLAYIDRDPKRGYGGGSGEILSIAEQEAHDKAHRFFNYQIRRWLDEVRESK